MTDGRVLFLDYTPTSYPYTIEYSSEVETINTAFLPSWSPVERYLQSVEQTEFAINYPQDLGFKYKERNFNNFNIKRNEYPNSINFHTENLKAIKYEDYSPAFNKINPSSITLLPKMKGCILDSL